VDDGKFEVKLARNFFRQLIEGMEHCHQNGIIHRDLKPDNLLCTKKFVLKIADFGLAGIVPETPDKILKTAVGTMAYMAPELLEIRESNSGANYQGEPVDIFSAGVILFTMIRGIMPFEKASDADSAGNWQKIKKGSEMGTFDPFWERHTLQSPDTDGLSDTFMRLIEGLLHPKPDQRWTIKQIKECAWYNEEAVMDEAEVVAAMKSRRRTTREKKQEKRNRIDKEKGKGYVRGVGDEEMKYQEEEHQELIRKIAKHNPKTFKHLST
jgi:serine/threonine protein kinase